MSRLGVVAGDGKLLALRLRAVHRAVGPRLVRAQ